MIVAGSAPWIFVFTNFANIIWSEIIQGLPDKEMFGFFHIPGNHLTVTVGLKEKISTKQNLTILEHEFDGIYF